MSLADGVRVLAHRKAFADLDAALALVGVRLGDESDVQPSLAADLPLDAGDEELLDLQDVAPVDGWNDADLAEAVAEAVSEAVSETEAVAEQSGYRGSAPTGPGADDDPSAPRSAAPLPQRPKQPFGSGVIAYVLTPSARETSEDGWGSRSTYHPLARPGEHPQPVSAEAPALDPATLPATLRSLLRSTRRSQEPDIEAAVDAIARRELFRPLPMRQVRSMPGRLRLMIDAQLAVGPFATDVDAVVETVVGLFGVDRVERFSYTADDRLSSGWGPVWTWRPYDEHPAASSVLFVAGHPLELDGGGTPVVAELVERVALTSRAALLLFGVDGPIPQGAPYRVWVVHD